MSECRDIGLVQIKADNEEIKRRISAFMARKRREVDELNIQEFCNVPRAEVASEFSCARVDAIFVRRFGDKGHVKVSKASNDWGPQTMDSRISRPPLPVPQNPNVKAEYPEAIEERLQNMESHLKIKSVPKDIYERIKSLEDRILFLEGLSLDYFAE